ncbi:uncharacterized protein LOC143247131 [Tachypleus tridentatus]|uniref:uncharacterized protein LOC143247131 n=1 Tax=Tachypleus tridentatus TaxID=6853 RepID=UPI003FD167BE
MGVYKIIIAVCLVSSIVFAQKNGLSILQAYGWWGSNKNSQPGIAVRSRHPFPLVRFKRGVEELSDGKMEHLLAINALHAASIFKYSMNRNSRKSCIARLLCDIGVDGSVHDDFGHNMIGLLGVEEDTSVLKNAFDLGMTHKSWMLCRNLYGNCST